MADYGSYFIQEGSPINQGYVLKVDRIIQTQEDLDYVEELSKKYKEITDENGNVTGRKDYFQTYKRPELGDVLYKDMNGDGTLDDNDRIKRGHGTAPRFFYDINVGFEYKGFDFSMLMSGTGNYYVQSPFRPQRSCRSPKMLAASLNAFFGLLRFTASPMVLRFRRTLRSAKA